MPKFERTHPLLASHLLWPLLLLSVAGVTLEMAGIDLLVADRIYLWSGGAWSLRDAWITSELIHSGGRTLVGVLTLVLLLLFAGSWLLPAWHKYRRALSYLLIATLTAGLLINVLKQLSHVDCPWDLLRYGGNNPYASLYDLDTWSQRQGGCFPAGHASAGYAWFGLYYLARQFRPHWQLLVLCGMILAGLVFGLGQQLRGAHFVSHDLWTAGLCWLVATGFYLLFIPEPAKLLRSG